MGVQVLPITPALQSSIVKSFQSTFALVNWESNVTLSNVPLLNNISFLPPGAGLAPGAAPGEAPQLAPASAPAADSMGGLLLHHQSQVALLQPHRGTLCHSICACQLSSSSVPNLLIS